MEPLNALEFVFVDKSHLIVAVAIVILVLGTWLHVLWLLPFFA